MSDSVTPADFWRAFWTWFGVGVFLLALCAGIILGGWKAGWWLSNQNANLQYKQNTQNQQGQTTLRQEIDQQFGQLTNEDVQLAGAKGNAALTGEIKVEEAAQAGQLCQEGTQVNNAVPLTAQETQWFNANCSLGVVRPTSKYYIPSAP